MDRVALLKEVLSQNPDDTFARYGLAMEYSRAGEVESALAEFNTILAKNPDYIAAYQMAGQMLSSADRRTEASTYLQKGIAVARRLGSQHATSEMEMLLDEISR